VRWTVPRFRYDQVMHLGWKVMLPTALAFILITGAAILVLDSMGWEYGLAYGLVLTVVNAAAMAAFFFWLDNDRVIVGSPRRMPHADAPEAEVVDDDAGRPETGPALVPAGSDA
jgi:hypothetical protein